VSNLTLVIDDDVLKRARIRALEHGTSVNALVREYLERYAAGSGQPAARTRLLELSERLDAGSGGGGRGWTRAELYEDRVRSSR
jgi:plasmid stability protein